MKQQSKIGNKLLTILTFIILLAFLVPFFWTFSMSLKNPEAYWTFPVQWWPKNPTLDNYKYILFETNSLKYLVNSLTVASLNTLLVLLVSTPAAYAIVRFKIGGPHLSFWFLAQRMAPPIAVAIPTFLLMNTIGILDTLIGLVLVYCVFNTAFAVWMLMSFFHDFPVELEEAALIAGCNKIQMLWKVVIPVSAPTLVVTGIFCFIFAWSEFVMTFILTREEAKTVTVHLVSFQVPTEPLWGEMSALLIVTILPITVLVLTVQKYIVTGLTSGAVKG